MSTLDSTLDAGLALYTNDPQDGFARSLLPLSCARGCRQTLILTPHASVYRNLEGTLVTDGGCGPLKYRSTLQGKDLFPPGVDGLGSGSKVWVDCVTPLAFPLQEPSCLLTDHCYLLSRRPVPGSVILESPGLPARYVGARGLEVDLRGEQGTPLIPGSFVRYRPRLHMAIVGCEFTQDSWELETHWTLTLEEI